MKLLTALTLMLALAVSAGATDVSAPVQLTDEIMLEELAPGVWWHRSSTPEFRSKANGLLVITKEAAVMIDTPWTDAQTGQLFDWVRERFGVAVKYVIPTHSHVDCMGGLGEAHRRGAESYALEMTAEFARKDGNPVPKHTFAERMAMEVGGVEFELRYFGAGHTRDNFVVWIPARKVLFGGCLFKSDGAGKGSTVEADVAAWPETVRKVMAAYPEVQVVVPGHGRSGGAELLEYTVRLFSE